MFDSNALHHISQQINTPFHELSYTNLTTHRTSGYIIAPQEAVYPPMDQANSTICDGSKDSRFIEYRITASMAHCSCSGRGQP